MAKTLTLLIVTTILGIILLVIYANWKDADSAPILNGHIDTDVRQTITGKALIVTGYPKHRWCSTQVYVPFTNGSVKAVSYDTHCPLDERILTVLCTMKGTFSWVLHDQEKGRIEFEFDREKVASSRYSAIEKRVKAILQNENANTSCLIGKNGHPLVGG